MVHSRTAVVEQDGYRLMLRRRYDPSGLYYYDNSLECYDIEIDDSVKEIEFTDKNGCSAVDLKRVDKQFPNIEIIRIAKGIDSINISNKMFPNVKMIYSQTYHFMTRNSCLRNSRTLLNAFCQSSDREIDLKGVKEISPDALDGCKASLINVSSSLILQPGSLNGYTQSLKTYDDGAITCLGDIIIGINKKEGAINIPKNVRQICDEIVFPESCTVYIYPENIKALLKWNNAQNDKRKTIHDLHVNIPKGSFTQMNDICELFNCQSGITVENITLSENQYFSSKDGVIYSKNSSKLLYFPKGRTGTFKVPEGVKEIADSAFFKSKISEVIFSDSVEYVGSSAFGLCEDLVHVELRNTKVVSSEAFTGCSKLRNINLGNSLEEVDSFAFKYCKRIKEMTFPRTIRKLGASLYSYIERLTFEGDHLPKGITKAVCYSAEYMYAKENRIIECNLANGRRVYIPALMTEESMIKAENQIDLFGDTDFALDFLYQYARDSDVKYKCAMLAYKENQNSEIGVYLSRVASKVIDCFLGDESTLIEFLSLGIVKTNTLKKALSKAEEKNYTTAKVYILNNLMNKGSDSFRL